MINPYIIKRPIITEKSLLLANTENTYIFEVDKTASKRQIQEAVEKLFSVQVVSVNTILGHNSTKPTGRRRLKSNRSRAKKALIKLKQGDSITLFDISGGAEQA